MSPEEFGQYVDEIVERLEPLGNAAADIGEYGFTLLLRGTITSAAMWLLAVSALAITAWVVSGRYLKELDAEVEEYERKLAEWQALPDEEKRETVTHTTYPMHGHGGSSTTEKRASTEPRRPNQEGERLATAITRGVILGVLGIPFLWSLWNILNAELVAVQRAFEMLGIG